MFCRNCGKETAPGGEYCMNCGARPLAGTAFCPACASPTTPLSEICVKCGTKLTNQTSPAMALKSEHAKSKVVSILLAVFLGVWTWLYTYKKDGWKFWVGIGIGLVSGILYVVFFGLLLSSGDYASSDWTDAFIGSFIMITVIVSLLGSGVQIWAIVDTAIKKSEWYDRYPDAK
jgi:uncharacterized membrane protein YvbJ